MSEKKGRWKFPLEVDVWGGVSMTSEADGVSRVNFSLQEDGGAGVSREVNGADWRISSGEGYGRFDIEAAKDVINFFGLMPFMILTYSRASGHLTKAMISGVDLAVLAGTKMALAGSDWDKITDLKQFREDRLINLVFDREGQLQLLKLETVGKEVSKASLEEDENLGREAIGFLPGRPNYSWRSNLEVLTGEVGFEVFGERIIFFYEKMADDGPVRKNVMEVPRLALATTSLDKKVTSGMPTEDDLLYFMEDVYLSLL